MATSVFACMQDVLLSFVIDTFFCDSYSVVLWICELESNGGAVNSPPRVERAHLNVARLKPLVMQWVGSSS